MVRLKWTFVTTAVLGLAYLVQAFTDVNEQTKTACVGRCSYQYSLQCPVSQKIALRHLEYATKEVSLACPNIPEPCQNKRECCSYDSGDCRIPFSDTVASSIYTKCSGKQECHNLRAVQISTASRCYSRNVSNYVAATYKCISDDTFINVCSNRTVYGKAVNLILNGSEPTVHSGFKNSNLCACVISTSDCDSSARLRFQAVDVRLHQNQDITQCHHHSMFDITDGQYNSRPRSYKCQENHFYRNFIDLYYSRKPYARISLYNKPELNISQLWLRITATLSDVDVMVTCGANAVHRPGNNVCVPPEFYPTTTMVYSRPTTYNVRPEEDKGSVSGNIGQKKDWIPIISGAVAAIVLLTVVIVVLCCCRRRRMIKKKSEAHFTHSMTVSAPALPTPPGNDYEYDSYGVHYYDSVENNETFATSPFVQPLTPGKNMGSFFPSEAKKISLPIVPVVAPVPPVAIPTSPAVPPTSPVVPPTVPSSPPPESSYDKDANPYQQPWDGKPLPMPNRRKKSDLAYATSDEIQVLIQRMDKERRRLNEGAVCTSPMGFIHIDDYKLSKSLKDKDKVIQEEGAHNMDDDDDDDKDEDADDSQKLLNHRQSSHLSDDRHLPDHVHLDPHDVMCSSEDTGYRSVGSQEQILVSEDDYLVPGSVKTRKEESSVPLRPSSQSESLGDKSQRISSTSENKDGVHREMTSGEQYADVYDALNDGKTVDVKTKL